MTHTHTIATLAELRTALAAGTEPSPCLARRTSAVLAGSHARFLVRIADGREATAALLYARIAAHRHGQTTAVKAYTIAAQCAFSPVTSPRPESSSPPPKTTPPN